MPQVFISYAHAIPDRALAAMLLQNLESNGITVWVDSKINLGQNWVEQIDTQLRNSTHFIALLSAVSVKSDMVRREIAMAYRLKKADKLAILPVRLDFDEELPYELGAYLDLIQYTVWRHGESFEPICAAIVRAVGTSLPASLPALEKHEASPPSSAAAFRFEAGELERVKSELARHLGPVARVMVDRAVRKARNWRHLYDLLAAEVPAGEERRRFEATRPH